jgi:hypothetical protein
MEHTAQAREQAEAAARDAVQALHEVREQAAARADQADADLAAARAQTQAARRDATRAREHDQQRHATELAAATARLDAAQSTITSLREQLAHAHSALDRERAEQHKTVSLLHDLLTNRPDTTPAGDPHTAHNPAPTSGTGTHRRSPTPHR